MEAERKQAEQWLDKATGSIRFGPDRRAVRGELAAHVEDKTADFRRIFPDMTDEEAEKRALAEMGDAQEIGKELARIHRPWLGWLWRASQTVLAAALLVLVLVGANIIASSSTLGGWYGRGSNQRNNMDGAVFLAAGEEKVELEGCILTVPEAAVWSGIDGRGLEIGLRADSLRFWEKDGRQFEHITATDDLGCDYTSQYEWRQLGMGGRRNISVYRESWGPFHQLYRLRVYGIDPAAQWVRLDYRWMGRGFSLTVDLTKEAGA